MKKYYDKVSLWSRFVQFILKFTDDKKIYSNIDSTKKFINKLSKVKPNDKAYIKTGLKKEKYNKMDVYSLNGTLDNCKEKVIVYLHGGSFVEEAITFQLKFAKNIALKSDATLIVPKYVLIPHGGIADILYEQMIDLYDLFKDKDVILLGDSAGGGFILSFAMFLRDNKIKLPSHVIMMSPWLDLTLTNPDLVKSEKLDCICSIEGNKYAGLLWANNYNIKDYHVSPIFGKFNDLPKMTIITGSRDVMCPECIKLSKLLDKKNIDYNYIEYKEQGHDFGAYPTKEGKLLIEDIVNIIGV